MRSKTTKTHLEQLAKKYGLRLSQVEEIVEAPFKFFVQIAKEGNKEKLEFDSVRIIKWGLFSVKKGRKEFFKKIRDDREKNKSRQRVHP